MGLRSRPSTASAPKPIASSRSSRTPPYDKLVPQIDIAYGNEKQISILEAGHRLGDAIVRCVGKANGFDLREAAQSAFKCFLERNDATEIATLAPTSLVFGAWDSRDTGGEASAHRAVGRPRLERRPAAPRGAVHPAAAIMWRKVILDQPEGKEAGERSERGYRHAPAVWRDDARRERVLGGIVAHGPVERDVTVNLVALRRLGGDSGALRRYVLGLSLVAATAPLDPFLRQGCLLVPDVGIAPDWTLVGRGGERTPVALSGSAALDYAQAAAGAFGVGTSRRVSIDKARAKEDAKKADKKSKAAVAG